MCASPSTTDLTLKLTALLTASHQDRFVKIENNFLHYFKSESDAKNVSTSLGGVSLDTVDWVRPYDNTPGESVSE